MPMENSGVRGRRSPAVAKRHSQSGLMPARSRLLSLVGIRSRRFSSPPWFFHLLSSSLEPAATPGLPARQVFDETPSLVAGLLQASSDLVEQPSRRGCGGSNAQHGLGPACPHTEEPHAPLVAVGTTISTQLVT